MANPFPFATGDVLTAANMNAIGEWYTWTPTFANVSAQPGVKVARYAEVNNTVFWAVYIDFDGAGTVTGSLNFNAPVPITTAFGSSYFTNGIGWARPDGGTFYQVTALAIGGIDDIYVYAPQKVANDYLQASDNVNASTPITWTSAGELWLSGYYRAT